MSRARLAHHRLTKVLSLAGALLLSCTAKVNGVASGPTPPPASSSLAIEPRLASVPPGGTQTFEVVRQGAVTDGVEWSASAGTISGEGLYRAPSAVGSYTVQARYHGWTGTASVTVASPGTPPSLYTAASAACAATPLRSTGTIRYFCDCRSGAQTGCKPGADANDGLSPSTAKQTLAAATTAYRAMNGGDTIAFCMGGAFEGNTNYVLDNTRCAAAADMRAAANTTTCDIREYPTAWGGTAKPILRQTASTDLFQFYNSPADGVRVLNLDFEGGGTGCSGQALGQRAISTGGAASHFLICNNTFNRWYLGVHTNPGVNPNNTGFDIYGNTFVMNSLDGWLGGGDELNIEANYLEDNGSCSATTHVLYPAGNSSTQTTYRNLRIHDNWIRFVNQRCNGGIISGHGTYDGVLYENNLVQAANSTSGCWGIGMAPDGGYANVVQYERNFIIRRNWIEGAGYRLISCASCPGAIIEDNVVISSATAGLRGQIIAVPAANARTSPSDPITTDVQIRNNTIYVLADASNAMLAIGPGDSTTGPEGTGYVIANNSIYMPNGGECWFTPWSDDRYTVTNNACFGGKWDDTPASSPVIANPQYANAPTDFTPVSGSPLQGTGTSTFAPATDFNLNGRPSPPSIGAFEP